MKRPPTLVDELRRAQDGEPIAVARLITALYGPVRRAIAAHAAGYPEDILADATQEAMVCVNRRLAGCRASTDGALVRWAMVVGWHEALRYLRSPAAGLPTGFRAEALDERATNAADVTAWLQIAADPVAPEGTDDDATTADRPLALLVRVVAHSYATLPSHHTDVLWRRAVIGAPYRELAATYSTTAGATKRRFQRAVATLRRSVLQRAANLQEPERTAVLGLIGAFATASENAVSGRPPDLSEGRRS